MAVYKIFPLQDASIYSAYPFLNTGLDAIADNDTLQMVCVEALYDYTQTEPDDNTYHRNNFFQNAAGTTGYDPAITYTMGETYKISSGKVNISSGKVTIK